MKINISFLLALVIVLGACKNQDNEINEYAEDGTLLKRTVFPDPVAREYYREYYFHPNGEIKSLTEYTNGIRDGRDFSYYENGSIKTVYYYDNGWLNSVGRFYNATGKLTDKGLFIYDSLMVKAEFFYKNGRTRVNVFERKGNDFSETGHLLYDASGRFAVEQSDYYVAASADSISFSDSLKVSVDVVQNDDVDSRISLMLGNYTKDLSFAGIGEAIISDSLSLAFYYKPSKKGYNLIIGKLTMLGKNGTNDQVKEYIFYHDFLAY